MPRLDAAYVTRVPGSHIVIAYHVLDYERVVLLDDSVSQYRYCTLETGASIPRAANDQPASSP